MAVIRRAVDPADQRAEALSMDGYPARKLTVMAVDWLRDRYPDAIIVSEFCVGNWGSASIDVAAITQDEIIGVEIKGDGDSPARIKLQACAYGRAATRMWMLPSPSLAGRVFDKHMPIGWGRLEVDGDKIKAWTPWQPQRLANAPLQLTETLWKPELVQVAHRLSVPTGKRDRVDEIQEAIAETVPMRDIRREVVSQLRRRNWRHHYDEARVDMPTEDAVSPAKAPKCQGALL